MSIVKALRFPVSLQWEGGRLTTVWAPSKEELEVATPPEFPGGMAGVWSPEELLVASVASCYAVTLAAVAERREIPLHNLQVSGTGHVSRRDAGRFGFVAVELDVVVATNAASVRAAEAAARKAEDLCLISQALDIPVHVGMLILPAELHEREPELVG